MSGEGPVVVAVAENSLEANLWVDALRQAGIRASSFERGHGGALGAPTWRESVFPVLVRASEIGAARSVIADLGGARALAPVREPADAGAATRLLAWVVAAVVVALVLGVAAGKVL